MTERCKGRIALQTKSKGGATTCLQHNSASVEEGTAPKLKGRSSARFLCANLTFGARFSLQDFGMRENMDILGSYHMLVMRFRCNNFLSKGT